MRSFEAAVVAVMTVAGFLPGCAPQHWGSAGPRLSQTESLALDDSQVRVDRSAEANLAAVAEFLERTSEYQLPRFGRSSGISADRPGASAALEPAVGGASQGPKPIPDDGTSRSSGRSSLAVANAQVALEAPAGPSLALPVIQSVSIHATSQLDETADEPEDKKATNKPLGVSVDEKPALVDRLLSRLKERATDGDDMDAQWQLRLVQLALGFTDEALQVSSRLTPEMQRVLGALLRAVAAVRSAARNPLADGREALRRVEVLRDVMADRADPVISTVALCRKVLTFGVYDEMTAADFVAGRTIQTIVYTEVRNLRVEPTDEGLFRTRLSTRLELLTADGQSLWHHEEPEIVDVCRRRRTDFFIAQRVQWPPTVPAGDYVLKVSVTDGPSGRVAETTHPFVINSLTSVAKTP